VSQFGYLTCPDRLDVSILILADFHGCVFLTLTFLDVVVILDDWARLYMPPSTPFILCVRTN